MGQTAFLVELLINLFMGLIQGITEVFPVSSSGHLAITNWMLKDTLGFGGTSFEIATFLHFGTFIAILKYYQKDVVILWRTFFLSVFGGSKKSSVYELGNRTPFLLLISLLTSILLGLFLRSIAIRWFENPLAIGGALIINGILIYPSIKFSSGYRKIGDLRVIDYIIIGLMQGLALLPGLSRFGFTLSAGLWRKLNWFDALKLSFLLSLPLVLAAGISELLNYDSIRTISFVEITGILIGILTATVGGCLAIKILLRQHLHDRRKLASFGIYCIALGLFSSVYYVAFLR